MKGAKPKRMYVDWHHVADANFDRVAHSATWNENELWPLPYTNFLCFAGATANLYAMIPNFLALFPYV